MNNIKNFVFNLFLPLLLAILVTFATKNDYSNVELLNRNIILPPIIFIVVWSILYILMGLFSYFYEKDNNNNFNICIYWISLLFNLLFTFILFTFKNYILAFIDTIILLIMIVYLFINSLLKKRKYAYLLLPYIIWLLCAFTLMLDIIVNN